jgi:hypothetical protein
MTHSDGGHDLIYKTEENMKHIFDDPWDKFNIAGKITDMISGIDPGPLARQVSGWLRKHLVILVIDAVCLILFAAIGAHIGKVASRQIDEHTAERWNAGLIPEKYAQVSVFSERTGAFTQDTVSQIRSSIQKALTAASMIPQDMPKDAHVWTDCYSAQYSISVSKDTELGETSAADVTAVGVGGDFFVFHPLRLLSGSYFSDDDIEDDHVIIDSNLAWQLFGSSDVAGMYLYIGNRMFIVGGVAAAPAASDGRAAGLAYRGSGYIYIPFRYYTEVTGSRSVTEYEAVMPQPVKRFAFSSMQNALGVSNAEMGKRNVITKMGSLEMIENSRRYDSTELLADLERLPEAQMRGNALCYPYWENVQRYTEFWLMWQELLRMLMLVLPGFTVIMVIWDSIRDYGRWRDRRYVMSLHYRPGATDM